MSAHAPAYGSRRPPRQRCRPPWPALLAALLLAVAWPCGARARPLHLLVLGDSLTAGYGLPRQVGFQAQLAQALHAAGRDVVVLDGAVSGDTSTDAAARLDWVLAGDPVDAALVELGGNDALRGLDPDTLHRNLAYILHGLAQRHIPVLLSGMLPPPSLGAGYGERFRAAFAAFAHQPGVMFDPFFMAQVWGHPDLLQADGIHPNAKGVALEVRRLLPVVERLLAAAGGASPTPASLRTR